MQQAFLKMLNSRIVEDRTFMARVSEEAQMFDDMIIYIKELLGAKSDDFTVEERNLINVAFKNWIELERKSIKLVSDLSENPKLAKYKDNMKAYQKKLEQELDDKSNAIINIIHDTCIPLSVNSESKIFFLKMVGDFYRYQAEHIVVPPFAHLENRTFQDKKAVMLKNLALEKVEHHY